MMKRKGAGWLIVSVLAVFAIGWFAAMQSGGVNEPVTTQAQPTETPWMEIVTPPSGYIVPETPLLSEDEVLDYVEAIIESGTLQVVESHVKRTTMSDFQVIIPGSSWATLAPGETPRMWHPMSPTGQKVVWVVGLRMNEPVSKAHINAVFGRSGLGGDEFYAAENETFATELYLVLDSLGNAIEVGLLNRVSDTGTPEAIQMWALSDIDSLPPAP